MFVKLQYSVQLGVLDASLSQQIKNVPLCYIVLSDLGQTLSVD